MNASKTILFILMLAIIGVGYFALTGEDTATTAVAVEHHDDDDDYVESYEIYPGDLVEKIKAKDDIILLDVRTPDEYEEVHLENALLLPVQELSARSLEDIGLGDKAKDKEIYLYCRSGARSKTAYDIMDSLGYTNIKSVAGGMVHWEEDEYPFTEVGAYEGSPQSAETDGRDVADAPELVIDRTLHDFGFIPQYGGVVETTFTLKNAGDAPLEIGDITTSCSCTSASIDKSTVPAQGEAVLTVVFDPDFHGEPLGVFKRTVFVPTNDPRLPEAEVSIQVDINEGV